MAMESYYTSFFSAIEKGDHNTVVQFLTNGEMHSVIRDENEEGKTAFQIALETKNYGKY